MREASVLAVRHTGGAQAPQLSVGRTHLAISSALAWFAIGLVSVITPASAGASGWSIVSSPDKGIGEPTLNAVSCSSTTSCVAVGSYDPADGLPLTLTEIWNGTSWSVVPSPNSATNKNYLNGVSCFSASFCTAVGDFTTGSGVWQTLIETWNGNRWSIASSPNTGTNDDVLNGVSCLSASLCTAVGEFATSSGIHHTLIETWDGSSWSIVASPNSGTSDNELDGAACLSATLCTAVGQSGSNYTLIESWNGSSWSIVPSPNAGTSNDSLMSVSCVSASSCTAVGHYSGNSGFAQTLAEAWNGTSWSIVPSPNGGVSDALSSVTCVSASSCTGVGDFVNNSGVWQTLIETWNGSGWSIIPSPNSGTQDNFLTGVSCVSTTACMAAGWSLPNTLSVTQTLIEGWNGSTWSIVPTTTTITSVNYLSGVSCASPSSCTAVGEFITGRGSVSQTLIEAWNGARWSIVRSPNQGRSTNRLLGLSCVSASACTAVGEFSDLHQHGINQTLVETWNGRRWAVVPSPDSGTGDNALLGVSCISTSSCAAVGFHINGGFVAQTLVETWNGTNWSIVSSPNSGTSSNYLEGVSCPMAGSCTAVGDSFNSTGIDRTLTESWNGTTWSIVPSPNKGSADDSLRSVSCTSATSCMAVGGFTRSGVSRTLIEAWNGTSWLIVRSPNRAAGDNSLISVSCAGASSCTAAGRSTTSSGVSQTLIESWNGGNWSIIASPNSGMSDNSLAGASCISTSSCTAVGDYTNSNGVSQTLVEVVA